MAAAIAADLLCWLRLLCLDHSLTAAEPKTAALPHPAHRGPPGPWPTPTEDQISETWLWARDLQTPLQAAFALTAPDLTCAATTARPRPEDPPGQWIRRNPTRPSVRNEDDHPGTKIRKQVEDHPG